MANKWVPIQVHWRSSYSLDSDQGHPCSSARNAQALLMSALGPGNTHTQQAKLKNDVLICKGPDKLESLLLSSMELLRLKE